MSKLKKKKKPMFHKPETTGEIRKIPTSLPVKILSIGSLVLLAALIAFAIYAMANRASSLSSSRYCLSSCCSSYV